MVAIFSNRYFPFRRGDSAFFASSFNNQFTILAIRIVFLIPLQLVVAYKPLFKTPIFGIRFPIFVKLIAPYQCIFLCDKAHRKRQKYNYTARPLSRTSTYLFHFLLIIYGIIFIEFVVFVSLFAVQSSAFEVQNYRRQANPPVKNRGKSLTLFDFQRNDGFCRKVHRQRSVTCYFCTVKHGRLHRIRFFKRIVVGQISRRQNLSGNFFPFNPGNSTVISRLLSASTFDSER